VISTLVMGNRADGAVGVIVQIVVMVNNGVELRAEEQQKHKCGHVPGYDCPQ
jgi:hypothetical protein